MMENSSNYENAQSQISNYNAIFMNTDINNENHSNRSNGYNNKEIINNNAFSKKNDKEKITNSGRENKRYMQENNDRDIKETGQLKNGDSSHRQFEPIFEKDNNKTSYCSTCTCFIF